MLDLNNPFSLSDMNILVTGASSGIGRAVAIEASKFNANLILTGRNMERLVETKNMLQGDNHKLIAGNLNDADFLADLIEFLPKLNGVVFSSGIMNVSPLKYVSNELIDNMVNTNYISNIKLTRDLQLSRKICKKSSLVYITSINGGVIGTRAHSVYASTKAALTGFAKSLSTELARSGTRVNCIAPGLIITNGIENAFENIDKVALNTDLEKYPLKRFGDPNDVAYSAVFLLSPASAWITGTTLVVDGGYTVQ